MQPKVLKFTCAAFLPGAIETPYCRHSARDEFIRVQQAQFVRDRREVCQLIAAGVNVRPKARQGYFLSDRHPSDRAVLLED